MDEIMSPKRVGMKGASGVFASKKDTALLSFLSWVSFNLCEDEHKDDLHIVRQAWAIDWVIDGQRLSSPSSSSSF